MQTIPFCAEEESTSERLKRYFECACKNFTLVILWRFPKNRIVIASDVSDRDGIGVEIYVEGKMVVETFRDDAQKTRVISVFKKEISLEDMEGYIEEFKEKIPWEFLE